MVPFPPDGRSRKAMTPIFEVGSRIFRVRFVQLISVVAGGAAIWGGVEALRRYGLHPTEGGELAPLAERLLLGGGIIALGIGILAGIILFGARYVTGIAVDEERSVARITVAGTLGRRHIEVPLRDARSDGFREGRSAEAGIHVNAPWYAIRLEGRRIPFILDALGTFPDPAAARRLLLPELPHPEDWKKSRRR